MSSSRGPQASCGARRWGAAVLALLVCTLVSPLRAQTPAAAPSAEAEDDPARALPEGAETEGDPEPEGSSPASETRSEEAAPPPPPPKVRPQVAADANKAEEPNEERPGRGARVYADAEHGLAIDSADGNYGIGFGFLGKAAFENRTTPDGESDPAFRLLMARPILRGHVFRRWIDFFVQFELAGASARLVDAQLTVRPFDAVGIRVGQFIVPTSRSYMTPVPALQFPDFSAANDFFRAGRDIGAMFFGSVLNHRLEYYAGIFDGRGIDLSNKTDGKLLYAGRVGWAVFGGKAPKSIGMPPAIAYDETAALKGPLPLGLHFGLSAFHDTFARTQEIVDPDTRRTTQEVLPDSRRTSVAADAMFQIAGLYSAFEIYHDWRVEDGGSEQRGLGSTAQIGQFVWPQRLELVARFSFITPNIALSRRSLRSYEIGTNGYIYGNNLKLQLRYALDDADLQLRSFQPGITHLLTLQLQAML